MICRNPNCGMENPENLIFCKYCGRRLKELKNNSKRPMQIIAALAALVLIFFVGRAVFNGSDKATDTKVPNQNGNNPQVTANGAGSLKFVFVRGSETAKEVYINNADGTTVKVTNSNKLNILPSFSPDGNKIAFERKDGNKSYVYIINSDGTSEKKIAEGNSPTWSSDGLKLFFYAKDPNSISNFIYSMQLDSMTQTKETNTQDRYFTSRFSNDGSRIAIAKQTIQGYGLYAARADFSGAKTLTTGQKKIDVPSWSMENNKIAFQNENDGNSEIYTADLNGNSTRITNNPSNDYNPSWTIDGKIIFTRDELNGSNIYIIDADGKNEKVLLRDASYGSAILK